MVRYGLLSLFLIFSCNAQDIDTQLSNAPVPDKQEIKELTRVPQDVTSRIKLLSEGLGYASVTCASCLLMTELLRKIYKQYHLVPVTLEAVISKYYSDDRATVTQEQSDTLSKTLQDRHDKVKKIGLCVAAITALGYLNYKYKLPQTSLGNIRAALA